MPALVDLKKFNSEPDAKIIRAFLDRNGVPAFVVKPRNKNPRLENEDSMIHLKVEIRNYERARALLEEKFDRSPSALDL